MPRQVTDAVVNDKTSAVALSVVPFQHPQGCRSYLIADPPSGEALVLDVHLDLVAEVSDRVRQEGWSLRFVVDSHTHADHPSGAREIAGSFGATRMAHSEGHHTGVTLHPKDGEQLKLGEHVVTVRHAPGHTPDHIVLLTDRELFAGDTLLIGGVARTDFLGGDAGSLHDSLRKILGDLDDDMVVFPGHDYEGRERTTVGAERAGNPWLAMEREEFARQLTANPPPRPANMDDLLRLNREGLDIPPAISAAEAVTHVEAGGATSVIDVRTGAEFTGQHVPGSRLIPLDQLQQSLDEVLATPAPRLLLCRTGNRAELAQKTLADRNVAGLCVIDGGIEAFVRAGGQVEEGKGVISLERQVRIGAGLLMLIGVGLGAFVDPLFLLLSAFVGGGMVFAGVTNWCGMALMLARAPWNKGTSESGAPAGGCSATLPSACAASAPSACAASPPTKEEA